MKIDRLIGILAVLLQLDVVTAPVLAEKFEVSRRTINRDIEDICKAGIPLVTTRGTNGGISIMEGYRIDRTLLTSSDMQAIFTGLKSLDSISGTNKYRQLMNKLSAGESSIFPANNHILIDLASWYKSSLSSQIEHIQNAINSHTLIAFAYYSPNGEGVRHIEPYYLIFRWSSWYVWGYCLDRGDYRMFKLRRILDLQNTSETFVPRPASLPTETQRIFQPRFIVTALFSPAAKWRLIDEFGPESFQEQPDDQLLFRFQFSDEENVFSWILSFGDQAELLAPEELRTELADRVKILYQKYGKTVAGISARTNNSDPRMQEVIGGLWERFYQDGIYPKIPDKKNDKALGIYSDYQGDYTGDYTVTVGCEAGGVEDLPVSVKIRCLPAGKYARFIVKGHMQKAVADFWQKLWKMDLNRAFTCDFEEYQNCDMENAVIHIYISLK